jgi:hypothetical protein
VKKAKPAGKTCELFNERGLYLEEVSPKDGKTFGQTTAMDGCSRVHQSFTPVPYIYVMIGQDEIVDHVARLVDSELLSSSPSLARLLMFCVKTSLAGEEGSLKETTIGVSCFGRSPGYDTKLDPIVRVNARRLRIKLEQFYEIEGRNSEIRIAIPKGTYVPTFSRYTDEHPISIAALDSESSSVTPDSEAPAGYEVPIQLVEAQKSGWLKYRMWGSVGVLLFVLTFASVTFVRMSRIRKLAFQETTQYQVQSVARLADTKTDLSLSHDGTKIAFSSSRNDSGVSRVYLQNSNSSLPTLLTKTSYPEIQPVWSEDGKAITLLREIAPTTYQLVQIDVATGSERVLRSIELSLGHEDPTFNESQNGKWFSSDGQENNDSARLARQMQSKFPSFDLPKNMDRPPGDYPASQKPRLENVSYGTLSSFEPHF